MVYAEANGLALEDIKGKVVRHKCDEPKCVNPEHLELGTPKDNMDDRTKRDRARGLSIKMAEWIVDRIDSGESGLAIGRELGIPSSTIYHCRKRVNAHRR